MKRQSIKIVVCCVLAAICMASPIQAAEQVLTIGLTENPQHLDPRFGRDVSSARVYQIVTNGLVQKDPQLNLIPCLAERWENPDEKTYIFHLRKGVKFHDDTELTAEDVKYTFESILDPEMNSPSAFAFEKIEQISVIDPYTVQFTLKTPYAPFLDDMVHPILPKHVAETLEGKRFTETLIGTGPFKLVEYRPDERLVFEANPDYFKGAPKLEKVIYRIIPDATTCFMELQQGGVDFLQNIVPDDMLALAQETEGVKVLSQESVMIYYLGLNLRDPYLQHKKVRQAIAYAIDRQSMIDHLLKGWATPATGLLSPSNWAYQPDVRTYPYDIEQAKTLLDEAGFPDPDGDGPEPRFSITFTTTTNPQSIQIGEIIQEQLKHVGIAITEIQVFEWAMFFENIKNGNFDMYRLSWIGISDPNMFHTAYHSSLLPPKGNNFCFYSNPRVDELTEQGQTTLDPEQRKEIYSEVQKILAEELPYIYLWYPHLAVVMNEKVQGFTPYPEGNFVSLKDVWIED